MKLRIFNALTLLLALLVISAQGRAQQPPQAPASPAAPAPPAISTESPDVKVDLDASLDKLNLNLGKLQLKLDNLQVKLNDELKLNLSSLNKIDLHLDGLKDLDKLDLHLDGLNKELNNLDIDLNTDSLKFDGDNDMLFNDQQDHDNRPAVEKEKTYTKSYPADANDKLAINNSYGKVTVNTWNKNEFKVEVTVKVTVNSDDAADKMLNAVTITDGKDGNVVSFRTNYNADGASKMMRIWDAAWSGSKVRKLEINYMVYMPARNELSVRNHYGPTELPDLSGKVTTDCAYGSLKAGVLSSSDNDLRVRYGNATIDGVTSSDIDMAYGSLEIGRAEKLNANFRYGSAKIGKLTSMGNISVKYGSPLVITDLDRGVKSLSVNCEYSGVKLGLSGDENADFDVTVKNGSFNYRNAVSITSKNPPDNAHGWRPTVNYKGKVGKGNPEKVITITSTYGSVNFD